MNCQAGTRVDEKELDEIIGQLLLESRSAGEEQRTQQREPFFAPVYVVKLQDGLYRSISCFSRDISSRGIGLLHNERLELGLALVIVPREGRSKVQLDCEILWCRPCGEGWYMSGARFLSAEANSEQVMWEPAPLFVS
jgi:hypothetical protein